MKKRNKIIIVLSVIGAVLIFSAINSFYNVYKRNKKYEEKGYQTTSATCKEEDSYIKYSSRKDGEKSIRYYNREYTYFVSGQEYKLNTVEADSKPYKNIKYNPMNPSEAETYEGINTETIVVFFIGLMGIFSPLILNIKSTNEGKYTNLRMSKRNIIKIGKWCFWGYLVFSLILVLIDVIFTTDWNQIITQYSQSEIIIECFIYIINRCNIKKFRSYFNIFGIQFWY